MTETASSPRRDSPTSPKITPQALTIAGAAPDCSKRDSSQWRGHKTRPRTRTLRDHQASYRWLNDIHLCGDRKSTNDKVSKPTTPAMPTASADRPLSVPQIMYRAWHPQTNAVSRSPNDRIRRGGELHGPSRQGARRRLHAIVNPQTVTRARSLFKDQQSGARSRYATLQGSHLRFDAPAHCRDRASPVEAISSARLCCPAPPDFGCLPRVTTVSGAAPNRPGPHDQGARRRLHAAVNPQTAARGRCILAQTSNRSRPPGHHTTLQVSHLCFGTPLHLRDRASPADAIGCTVLLSSAATFWCLPRVTSNSTELHISTSQHISQHIAARGHRGKRKIAPH